LAQSAIEANPACQPEGSEEKKAWRDVTPWCQPEVSEEKEAWRKLEGHQKRLTKRMAEPLPDKVVAAQQAEAKRMAAKKSAATVIEENKSTQADLKCKSCG